MVRVLPTDQATFCCYCASHIEVEVVNTHIWWVTVDGGDDVCPGNRAGENLYGKHTP